MSSVETVTVAPTTTNSVSITPPSVSNASTASTTITSTPNTNNTNSNSTSNSHHNNNSNNNNNSQQQQQQQQQHVSAGQNSAEIATTPAIDTSSGGQQQHNQSTTSTSTQKMNGLTLSELCCLFCCPPCPGRIAAKLAFLPPEPTYSVSADPNNQSKFTLKLSERADWQYNQRELDAFEVFYATSSRGNRIACMHIRATANPKFTILFSHGNAVDLGQMSSFYLGLGTRINCNIFSYDYSGYGASSGKPSEKNLYADINTAWQSMRTKFGISPDKIILYGQSIGTVPTVDLASRYEVGAVILHSPLMSGLRVAFPNTKRSWFFDAFPSIDKIPKINSPVLVIHGTEDEVIDFSHGVAIYERCPKALEPLWVQGASHNDVELYCQYLDRLKQLITVDLAPTSS